MTHGKFKKKLEKNHSFRMNLLRKKAIFAHKKPEPHEDTMVQWKIRWVERGVICRRRFSCGNCWESRRGAFLRICRKTTGCRNSFQRLSP